MPARATRGSGKVAVKGFKRHSASPYLAPGPAEPLGAALTGAVVAHLRVGGTRVPAALQRKAADVVGQAQDPSGSYAHPTLSGTLQKTRHGEAERRLMPLPKLVEFVDIVLPFCPTGCRTSSWRRLPYRSSPHQRAADSCCTPHREQSRPRC